MSRPTHRETGGINVIAFNTSTALVVALGCVAAISVARRLEAGRIIALAIFATYLVGVANLALLPLVYDPQLAEQVGPIDLGRLVELRPFFLGGTFMPTSQALLNILMTVPFGFGLPFVLAVRLRWVLVLGVIFSVGIETAQLLADAAYLALPTWSVDINDVILNSIGVAVGVLAFCLAGAAYRATLGQVDLRVGPWAHFHDTLLGSAGRA